MNLFDLVALALIALAAYAGSRSGALPQLGGLAGAALGAGIGLAVLPLAHDWLATLEPLPRAVVVIGGRRSHGGRSITAKPVRPRPTPAPTGEPWRTARRVATRRA